MIFIDFSSIREALGPPKSFKITKKLILGRVLDASFFEGGFGEGFGRILVGFLMDLSRNGPHS